MVLMVPKDPVANGDAPLRSVSLNVSAAFRNLFREPLNVFPPPLPDKNGLECDAVVHLRNGDYGLVEIKLGGDSLIEEGASSLKNLASKIDTTKMKAPAFMMVLTAIGAYAYRREDGVWIVPGGSLKN